MLIDLVPRFSFAHAQLLFDKILTVPVCEIDKQVINLLKTLSKVNTEWSNYYQNLNSQKIKTKSRRTYDTVEEECIQQQDVRPNNRYH